MSSRRRIPLWLGLCLVGLLTAGIGVAVQRVFAALEEPSGVPVEEPAAALEAHPPLHLRPLPDAPRIYRDVYHGFAFDIPDGWVHYDQDMFQSFAPELRALRAYGYNDGPDQRWAPPVFTVTLSWDSRTIRRIADDFAERGLALSSRNVAIGRWEAVELMLHDANRKCPACIDLTYLLPWSDEILVFHVISTDWAADEPTVERVLQSFREVRPNTHLDAIEQFMRARVDGRDAERWLAKGEKPPRCGLYRVGPECEVDVNHFSIERAHLEGRRIRIVATLLSTGQEGGQTETFTVLLPRSETARIRIADLRVVGPGFM